MKSFLCPFLALVALVLALVAINSAFDHVAPPCPVYVIGNTTLGDSVIIDETCNHSGPMVERVQTIAGVRVVTRYGIAQYKRVFKLQNDDIFCWN